MWEGIQLPQPGKLTHEEHEWREVTRLKCTVDQEPSPSSSPNSKSSGEAIRLRPPAAESGDGVVFVGGARSPEGCAGARRKRRENQGRGRDGEP